jgi:hypothetical protein
MDTACAVPLLGNLWGQTEHGVMDQLIANLQRLERGK